MYLLTQLNDMTKTESSLHVYTEDVLTANKRRGAVSIVLLWVTDPYDKVHDANIGPIWGRQDPDGPHVGPMNFAIWGRFIVQFLRK